MKLCQTFGFPKNFEVYKSIIFSCMVSINAAARRRRSDSEDDADAPKTEQVMANLLIFEEASEEKDDIPVISVLQDPGVEGRV